VNGRLRVAVGRSPPARRDSAEDPGVAPLGARDAARVVPARVSGDCRALSGEELDTYYEEAAPIAIALGARAEDVPRDRAALARYLARMHGSGDLTIGADAKSLAAAVLSSRLAAIAWPLGWTNRQLTVGWLPEEIRRQYGFDWTARDERRSASILRWLRTARKALPAPLARSGEPALLLLRHHHLDVDRAVGAFTSRHGQRLARVGEAQTVFDRDRRPFNRHRVGEHRVVPSHFATLDIALPITVLFVGLPSVENVVSELDSPSMLVCTV
jgi:hypothetical protein